MAAIARLPYHDVISPSISITFAPGTSASSSGMCFSRNRNGSLGSRTRSTLPASAAGSTTGKRAVLPARARTGGGVDDRIAVVTLGRDGLPADELQRARDIGVPRDGHPRIAPDQV